MRIEYISTEGIRAAEKFALEKMREAFNNATFSQQWQGFAGFEMVDRVYRDREIDLILLTHDRLIVIELKDWFGKVTLMNAHWLRQGNDMLRSAVKVTSQLTRRRFYPRKSRPSFAHGPHAGSIVAFRE